MSFVRLKRLADTVSRWFPERHLHLRSGHHSHEFILSTRRQLTIAAVALFGFLWTGVCTTSVVANAVARNSQQAALAQREAAYARLIGDKQARLATAVHAMADGVERRHAALAMLLAQTGDTPGARQALTPILSSASPVQGSPAQRIAAVRDGQDRLVEATGTFAAFRAHRLRLALRLAGVGAGVGGPLISAKDPRALAAILGVDTPFANQVQRAAARLADMRALSAAAAAAPLARPCDDAVQSSGFGIRVDPFTTLPAFHPGLDFSGPAMTPVHATAPGVVAFAGQRSGYGNAVEIDHGHGLKTRYGHLRTIDVKTGQSVALGQTIGGMGSTGCSTGNHVHYEVWLNGRVQDPLRFVRAGDYARQTG